MSTMFGFIVINVECILYHCNKCLSYSLPLYILNNNVVYKLMAWYNIVSHCRLQISFGPFDVSAKITTLKGPNEEKWGAMRTFVPLE